MLEYDFDQIEVWSIIGPRKGEENAINQNELTEAFYPGEVVTESKRCYMRDVIRSLRKSGHPILSVPGSNGGYFTPKYRQEVIKWRDYMRAKAISEFAIINPVLEGCSRVLNTKFKQLELMF